MSRKFYKTVLTIEILSEDEPWEGTLDTLWDDVMNAHLSYAYSEDGVYKLTPSEMVIECHKQAIDPEFFLLDKNGNDIEEFSDDDDDDEEQLIDEW